MCRWTKILASVLLLSMTAFPEAQSQESTSAVFRAGAAMVDVTPTVFPVIVNGMVEERTATMAHDALMSRALVLDDGAEKIAIVVVDSLMLTRAMLDDAKEQASQLTGIPTQRMLISATHTHSAPSAMPCLGSRVDPEYAQFLPGQIVRSIVQANEKLVPAQAGWAVTTDDQHNHCRRWIFRSDRMTMADPFGQFNVRAHMHPGYQSPNHIGPSGPADTDLTLLSIQTAEGQPLAVLANYAMHYYGSPLVSGDFCGRFGLKLAELIGANNQQTGFVGIMSQGTSGDSMWPDYSKPAGRNDLDAYTTGVAQIAAEAYDKIVYRKEISLAMEEATLKLNRRVPDEARLKWAQDLATQVGDRLPRGWSEVYAFEQLRLHEDPTAELKLQAIRVGDFGITAIPDEVFGITGIKLKNRSPMAVTMNIELANGAEGYIPPPEQHKLGGYTTWAARTAGLEETAEPQIVETLTKLLEKVANKPRRPVADKLHSYAKAVLDSKPVAFWRLGEIECTPPAPQEGQGISQGEMSTMVSMISDAMRNHPAIAEAGIAFYLPGPRGEGFEQQPRGNRAVHFAGGRVVANVPQLGDTYSVECWVWNGFPNSDRAVTGYFFSRGPDGDSKVAGDHLGIGGNYLNHGWDGKLMLFNGNERDEALVGKTVLEPRIWNHVVLVRSGKHVNVYLNGNPSPEIDGDLEPTFGDSSDIYLGGRNDRMFGLEGRLDEVALYDRVLSVEEVAAHFAVAKATQDPQINEVIARPDTPPMSPEESMKVAHVREGFELQLVVAEPLVIDPVAIDWGPDGKLWVAEMADYPSGMDNNGKPGGRIRYLEDKDGDGQYETSTVLLQDIPFPTGVMAWGKGVLITAAPEIIYAEDSDNDGTADVRKTLFSGFLEGNQQLRVNGLRWGLDNWVHCASGSHNPGYGADSQILSHVTNQKTTVGSRDFRIRPDEGLIDPQSGPSQFGRNRDAWGNWFGEQNSYPLWHYVLEDPYIRRNPFFAPPDPRRLMTPSNPPVYAAAPPEKRFHSFEQSGRYTSACSGIVYLDEMLFGASKADGRLGLNTQHVFTCEPFSNLVQHNLLIDDGVSFRLERDPAEVDAKHDFFASEDRWCRPVMVRTGPDGALWIVDMYRYMIEHPHWLPKEGQDELRPFFRSGDDRGRIYRIVRKDHVKSDSISKGVSRRYDRLTTPELVSELESSNGWRRDMAQRLLVANADEAAVALLVQMVTEGQRPSARLHAMCTLNGTGKLSKELVEKALNDPHAGVRRWAVRLASEVKVPLQALVRMAEDEDAKVRLELACVAGYPGDAASSAAILSASLLRDTSPYVRAAVLSSLNFENVRPVINQFMKTAGLDAWRNPPDETDLPGFSAADRDELIASLFEQAASLANDNDLISLLMMAIELHPEHPQAWQFKSYARMLNRLKVRNWSIEEHLNSDTDKGRLAEIHKIACGTASDSKQHEALRVAAIPLLKCSRDDSSDGVILRDILTPQTSTAIQEAAIKHLGQQSDDVAAEILLANWASHSPLLRSQILTALSGRPQWITQLLTQMESGQVAVAEIDASMRQRLLTTRESAIRERLEKIFAAGTSADRKAVMESFQPALKLSGDATRGAAVFNKRCTTCHKQNGVGFEVGPNLASLTNRTPESLFTAILDPSSAVEAKYLNFVAVTTSGRSVIGLLSTETGSSLTLVAAEAKTESILRSDIEELRSTGKSLMPEGLEKDLSHQDLADVIEYVKTLMK